jgi:hypothetical protein
MVIGITRRMRIAANARGVTLQQLIRRLLRVVSRDNLFDTILPRPMPRSLGAARLMNHRRAGRISRQLFCGVLNWRAVLGRHGLWPASHQVC